MTTFEILYKGEIHKIRRTAETHAVAEIAWRLSVGTVEFRKTAKIRVIGRGFKSNFRPVW